MDYQLVLIGKIWFVQPAVRFRDQNPDRVETLVDWLEEL